MVRINLANGYTTDPEKAGAMYMEHNPVEPNRSWFDFVKSGIKGLIIASTAAKKMVLDLIHPFIHPTLVP